MGFAGGRRGVARGRPSRAGDGGARGVGADQRHRGDPYYAAALPGLLRCALALGEPALAARLIGGVEPRIPLQQHALATCRAALAEAAGDRAMAATAYADAATQWRRFGDLPELAYALLGQGRCLVALGMPEG